jgi:hypothetical protein
MLAAWSTWQRVQPAPAALELPGGDKAAKDFPRELMRVEVSRPQECSPARQGDDAVGERSGTRWVSLRRHISISTDVP